MLIAVYGSLRRGEFNHRPFAGYLRHAGTERLSGYDMYSLGYYPAVKRGSGSIVVDLFNVDDKSIVRRLHFMELSAGYSAEFADTSVGLATIWLMNQLPGEAIPVPDGDWSKFPH
jgi:gamma-glutamylcyclotransferase (GGCT)/AIG2-like uncharacterized protein YtfP